jgi:hypothetical protein
MSIDQRQLSLSVSSQRQLVDLNKKHTNFSLSVTCTCQQPFYARIATQNEIDTFNDTTLQTEKSSGTFHKSLRVTSNVYDTYFLMIWAETDCTVIVDIVLEPLNDTTPPTQENIQIPETAQTTTPVIATPKRKFWKMIIIFFLVLGVLYLGYHFLWPKLAPYLTKKSTPPSTTTTPPPSSNHIMSPPTIPGGSSTPSAPAAPPLTDALPTRDRPQSIIDNLNSIPL